MISAITNYLKCHQHGVSLLLFKSQMYCSVGISCRTISHILTDLASSQSWCDKWHLRLVPYLQWKLSNEVQYTIFTANLGLYPSPMAVTPLTFRVLLWGWHIHLIISFSKLKGELGFTNKKKWQVERRSKVSILTTVPIFIPKQRVYLRSFNI